MISNKKAEEEIMQSQVQKKAAGVSTIQREQISRNQKPIEILINLINNNQEQIKDELSKLSNRISMVENELKMNTSNEMLSGLINAMSLDKSYMNILLFIQKLDSYLFDSSINPEFAKQVHYDINRVLALYGYKIVDFVRFDEDSEIHYDIELVDSDVVPDIEIVSRAIIDKNEDTIVKGKVYIKNNI